MLERHRARPDLGSWTDFPEPRESALLAGETGILLVAYRLAPSAELAETLHTRVRENVHNEADEIMWGSPGTLIAARLMLAWTGEQRWRAAWDESAEALLARRDPRRALDAAPARTARISSSGPVHGLVGNVQSLLGLLDTTRRRALRRDDRRDLDETAFVEDGLANWPPAARRAREHEW